jgi:hypothetical protein
MPPLNDNSPFPWGVHEGVPMRKVPINYMHYVWCRDGLKFKEHNLVANWIKSKLPEWKKTHPGYNFE